MSVITNLGDFQYHYKEIIRKIKNIHNNQVEIDSALSAKTIDQFEHDRVHGDYATQREALVAEVDAFNTAFATLKTAYDAAKALDA